MHFRNVIQFYTRARSSVLCGSSQSSASGGRRLSFLWPRSLIETLFLLQCQVKHDLTFV